MINELDALGNKIAQVASLCRILRTENNSLRQQLAAAEVEKHVFAERAEAVRERIEQLVRQLPEGKTPI
jgi:cell division protein ZapB